VSDRPNWHEYFMAICDQVALRSTCDRKHVGAVIVDEENHILASGYNGTLPGQPHCNEVNHYMENGHCTNVLHAEINVVAHAAKRGICLRGTTLYCNVLPCWNCAKVIAAAGIKRVIFRETYGADPRVFDILFIQRLDQAVEYDNQWKGDFDK